MLFFLIFGNFSSKCVEQSSCLCFTHHKNRLQRYNIFLIYANKRGSFCKNVQIKFGRNERYIELAGETGEGFEDEGLVERGRKIGAAGCRTTVYEVLKRV